MLTKSDPKNPLLPVEYPTALGGVVSIGMYSWLFGLAVVDAERKPVTKGSDPEEGWFEYLATRQPSLEKVRVTSSSCCQQFLHQAQGNEVVAGHGSVVTALSVPRSASATSVAPPQHRGGRTTFQFFCNRNRREGMTDNGNDADSYFIPRGFLAVAGCMLLVTSMYAAWPTRVRTPEVGRGQAWRRPSKDQASFKTKRWTDLGTT